MRPGLKSFVLEFVVLTVFSSLPLFGMTQNETKPAKSFAVFVARYNAHNDVAVGGVAGTAFFINSKTAITAYHVLKSSSFETSSDFSKVRIWLVHENRPAIEVQKKHLREMKDQDMTVLEFSEAGLVAADEIYSLAPEWKSSWQPSLKKNGAEVETEGFVASSTGPVLARQGTELVIVKVPRLERIHSKGQLLQVARVDLVAADVNLKKADGLQVSFQPTVGLSGGPLLIDQQVVGMNSFADPSRISTWALRLPSN